MCSLLATLPPTHSLRTDPFKWRALQRYLHRTGDIGLVDLFLTAYEKPYRIDDIFDLLDHARLKLVTFVPPCTYDVRQYVTDPVLLSKVCIWLLWTAYIHAACYPTVHVTLLRLEWFDL